MDGLSYHYQVRSKEYSVGIEVYYYYYYYYYY
jgi:hypothetical protein